MEKAKAGVTSCLAGAPSWWHILLFSCTFEIESQESHRDISMEEFSVQLVKQDLWKNRKKTGLHVKLV